MTDLTDTEAQMIAAIGASIAGARTVGNPDPTDEDLTFDLSAGFAAADIRALLPRMKVLAFDAIRAAAELTALALILMAGGLWAGIFRGII